MTTLKLLTLFAIFFSHVAYAQTDENKHRSQTQIPTLYEVNMGGEKYYEDKSGQYRLTGILMDLGGRPKGLGKDLSVEQVKKNVIGKFGDLQPDRIRKTPVMGIYELLFGKLVKYMDGSGRFLFRGGELLDDAGNSLTSTALVDAAKNVGEQNLALLDQLSAKDMLIYPAENQRHILTVFTDTDCPYCRKFHNDIAHYTQQGVTVRYIFFPRSGFESASYRIAVSVWCSDDPQEALSKAEKGIRVIPARCDNPIDKHLALAKQLNLLGTPVLMLESGEMLYGYSHPSEVIARLRGNSLGVALN